MGTWVLLLWMGVGEVIGEPGPGKGSSLESHSACCMDQGRVQASIREKLWGWWAVFSGLGWRGLGWPARAVSSLHDVDAAAMCGPRK